MKTLSKEKTEQFLTQNPTILRATTNHVGQQVIYFEHPTRGEDAPIYVWICGRLAKTDFFDLDDIVYDPNFPEYTDYVPVYVEADKQIKMSYLLN